MQGERIRKARIELNWTQEFLAFKLKVSKNSVSKWEREKQVPTKEMQKKLERILKIKLAEEEKKTRTSKKKNCIENKIQQARKAKKLTQKELASKLGVSASKVSAWENNKSTPNAEMQEKLHQILDLNNTNLEAVCPNKKDVEQEKDKIAQKQDKIAQKQDTVDRREVSVTKQNEVTQHQDEIAQREDSAQKQNEVAQKQDTVAQRKNFAQKQEAVAQQQDEIAQEKKDAPKYKTLPLGVSKFEKIIREKMYYADHTRVIKDVIELSGEIKLITRPRRFGKTLTLNMLKCFFEYGHNPELFNGLEITKYPEICKEHQNQYPVVFLTFRDLDEPNFEDNRAMLCGAIFNEANRFNFLKHSTKLNQEEIQKYNELLQGREMLTDSIKNSLYTLIDLLYKHYEKEVVVLVDEYDVPLNKAHQEGYYDQMLPFIRSILRNGLKDNEKVKLAVITGCLKISKESIFTGLNNLSVYSMTSYCFADGFGFTKKEVIDLLEYYKLQDKYELIKEWYDGYRLGNEEIYCPWDVLKYVSELLSDRDTMPVAYWMNTSSNDIIQKLLQMYGQDLQDELSSLLNGEAISCKINENIVYESLYDTAENIWSILFATGYLRIEDKTWDESYTIYQLRIPNKEILVVFTEFVRLWTIETYKQGEEEKQLEQFCEAVEQGDIAGMEDFLNNFLYKTLSIKDYSGNKNQKESLYHGILLGLLKPKSKRWTCISNMETGKGYADIVLKRFRERAGVVIELKYAKSDNLEYYCQEAMQQINSRDYIEYFRDRGCNYIVKYAIAFFKKTCKVLKEKENL